MSMPCAACLLDGVGDGAAYPLVEGVGVDRLAVELGANHGGQIGRPRQAADMGRENALRAAFHPFLPRAGHARPVVTPR